MAEAPFDGHELEPSILIGGWATFFRVGGDISHDIGLITSRPRSKYCPRVRRRIDRLRREWGDAIVAAVTPTERARPSLD